jgi:alkylated DNA repair dioxygenase AlkB
MSAALQLSLLPNEARPPLSLPEGFLYAPDFLSEAEEQALIAEVEALDWQQVEMHGVTARRRVVHYGLNYGYDRRSLEPGEPMPEWLEPFIEKAATRFDLEPAAIAEALITEYSPGAGIGWHRDAPGFDRVIGISLRSSARFRLRPYPDPQLPSRQKPVELLIEPRSVYLLDGPARWQWQHGIPGTKDLRYSITLRTLR